MRNRLDSCNVLLALFVISCILVAVVGALWFFHIDIKEIYRQGPSKVWENRQAGDYITIEELFVNPEDYMNKTIRIKAIIERKQRYIPLILICYGMFMTTRVSRFFWSPKRRITDYPKIPYMASKGLSNPLCILLYLEHSRKYIISKRIIWLILIISGHLRCLFLI